MVPAVYRFAFDAATRAVFRVHASCPIFDAAWSCEPLMVWTYFQRSSAPPIDIACAGAATPNTIDRPRPAASSAMTAVREAQRICLLLTAECGRPGAVTRQGESQPPVSWGCGLAAHETLEQLPCDASSQNEAADRQRDRESAA